MPMNDLEIRRKILRQLKVLRWLTVWLSVGLISLGTAGYIDALHKRNALSKEAQHTTASLCTLRHDLERRVIATTQFLNDHPHGVDGLKPVILRHSIADQNRTIKALSGLECRRKGE